MNDLTLLYYTANRINAGFQARICGLLDDVIDRWLDEDGDEPSVIAVVQNNGQPDRDHSICEWWRRIDVGHHPCSIYQVYKNILMAAKAATTAFVACCEDDTVYSPEHFTYRPALDTFAYDRNRWVITQRKGKTFFYWRERHQMAMCIAPRELLIETLEERFAKYPTPVPHEVAKKTGWGEPGRYEKNLGLAPRKLEYFDAAQPSVTFNHSESLMGRRHVNETDQIVTDLPPWGDASKLWARIHG